MTITEYIEADFPNNKKIRGFSIGKGKKIYWYITPLNSGLYRCLPLENDKTLGWPRFVTFDQSVTIHYII